MFKKKSFYILTWVLSLMTLLFTFSAYASNATGTIKVFFLNGLSARVYQIGTYNSEDVFTLSEDFKDLSSIEERELERYLENHPGIDGNLYTAADGEFVVSGMEKGVYYLTLVPNEDYQMNGIIIQMPMQVSEGGSAEWFYEIEPKFETKPSPEPTISKKRSHRNETVDSTKSIEENEMVEFGDTEVPKAHSDNKEGEKDKGGIHLSKTGDTFSVWIVIVMILSFAYIVWHLKKGKRRTK